MNELVKHNNGVILIHYTGIFNKDGALCGDDLAGDEEWESAKKTRKKVNCDMCIKIVKHCKNL